MLSDDGGSTTEVYEAQVLIHESRKRQRDVFSRITTPPPQKGVSANLRMAQPEYGARIMKQRSFYSRTRAPAWPTINNRTIPGQKSIWDSNQTLANVKHEPKSSGMNETRTRCNKNRGRAPCILTCKPYGKREPTRASDELENTPSDNITHKVGMHAKKRRWYPHPTKGRRFL